MFIRFHYIIGLVFIIVLVFSEGCKKDMPMPDPNPEPDPTDTTTVIMDTTSLDDGPIDWSFFSDTYVQWANPNLVYQWGHYNVHDPSYWRDEEFVYCYNTDVAFGHEIRPGIQIRRSKNFVEWEFVGWAFPGLPTMGSNFIRQNGGEPFNSLWAPFIIKVGDEYRLYYSLSSPTPRLSVIGLATSSSPKGPFREKGLVVTSLANATRQTNAIDPTVIIDENGGHWMYYGSAWDGIYKLELNPTTGLAFRNEDKGVRIAQRGFSDNRINGNIEGPEIIYNEEFGMYYLFIAYDWLETKYNVRVGRSESPNGPFYDYLGRDMNKDIDDLPMILAPYRFDNQSGWQGVSHVGIFKDEEQFYMGHQGRPGINSFYMVMHVRQIFWTEDGWPMVSSQRFATEEEYAVTNEEISGTWESILFEYDVVPGYAEEQTNPGFSLSKVLNIYSDGTMDGAIEGTWTFEEPWIIINQTNGENIKVRLERGRDWENEIDNTILFTGIQSNGYAIWGKKI